MDPEIVGEVKDQVAMLIDKALPTKNWDVCIRAVHIPPVFMFPFAFSVLLYDYIFTHLSFRTRANSSNNGWTRRLGHLGKWPVAKVCGDLRTLGFLELTFLLCAQDSGLT